jgi:hypothetical protein
MNKKEIEKLRQEHQKITEKMRYGFTDYEQLIYNQERRAIIEILLNGNLKPETGEN